MKILIVGCAAALMALAGCAGTTGAPVTPGAAMSLLDRVEARCEAVRGMTELLMPFLPATTQARIRAAVTIAETAMAAARAATTVAAQMQELRKADAALDTIETAAAPAPG